MFFRALGDVDISVLGVRPEYGAEVDGSFLPFQCKGGGFMKAAVPIGEVMLYVYRNYEVQIDVRTCGRQKHCYRGFCTKGEFDELSARYAAS